MDTLLLAYTAFLALVWTGLMAVALANLLHSKGKRQRAYGKAYAPKALVMVPCKGTDITLVENLRSLKRQSYLNYDIVAIIDSENDPSLSAIKSAKIPYIVSRRRWRFASGKVRALATAITKFRSYEVYVVADSDVTFASGWLAKLIAPLSDDKVGVSTTFPYFKPVGGFWSKVKLVWGFVGNAMMESRLTRFAWGGSMAFRKGLLDKKAFAKFTHSISDDIPITRIVRSKGLSIYYVPDRLAEVKSNDDFKKFSEWSNRQAALTLLGSRRNFKYGVVLYSANILLLVSSVALAVAVSLLFAIFLLPFLLGLARMYKRAGMPDPELALVYIAINFVYLANLLAAKRMTRIEWRGNTYSLRD